MFSLLGLLLRNFLLLGLFLNNLGLDFDLCYYFFLLLDGGFFLDNGLDYFLNYLLNFLLNDLDNLFNFVRSGKETGRLWYHYDIVI